MMTYEICQYWNKGKGFRCVGLFNTKEEAERALAIAKKTSGCGVLTIMITTIAKDN